MTTLQKNAISNKADGLIVYDTDVKLFSYWIVAAGTWGCWMDFPQTVAPMPNYWQQNGYDISNNNAGNVGIGLVNPTQKIEVAGKIRIGNDNQTETAGTIRYNSTNKYFEGFDGTNWGTFNANNSASLPQSAIVLSETKTNTNLTNAGYSLNGLMDIKNSQYVSGSFGWYKQLSTDNIISARSYQRAIWTGTKMILWGGVGYPSSSPYLNDGKTYNPINDTWSAISTPSFLSDRVLHSTIWTGTKMIVWGGTANNYLNDGGIYDPNTDSWTTINSSNAPSIRGSYVSIWTGSKMIIWGGNTSSNFLGDGKIYDLSTGTWASMSTVNAPSVRNSHTAIWTGSKMIIWGGFDGSPLPNGKIYNPANDSWTSINSTNAPQSGYQHSAIWTGSKMIIFGGNSASNSCKIYDPQTDIWVTGSSTNAPSLFGHTAVWTGSKMIVFGGNTNSGGIYDPITDSWDADAIGLNDYTTSIHSAVWTGEEMIIFYIGKGNMLKKDFKSPAIKSMYIFQKN